MENELISKFIPVLMLLILGVLEALGGLYFDDKRTKNDWTIELVSLFTLPTLIQPAIFVFALWLGKLCFPQFENYFISLAFGWQILSFLIADDLTQYWWHRFSHSNRILFDTKDSEIKILVATHDFFDSPHSYGFNFYPDFYVWLETLGRISEKTNYKWYLKTHPDPIGDSDKVLIELEKRFPKFEVIPSDTSHHELIKNGINIALTVFGTIGWEYPALGIPTINASKNNPHSKFNFSITPNNRIEYEMILLNLDYREVI